MPSSTGRRACCSAAAAAGACAWLAVPAHGHTVAHAVDERERVPHTWSDLPGAWTLDPGILIPLVVLILLYARGARRVLHRRTVLAFATGVATLVVALVSPLHAWGEALFAAH